jgi:hypothetical protein
MNNSLGPANECLKIFFYIIIIIPNYDASSFIHFSSIIDWLFLKDGYVFRECNSLNTPC